MSGRTRRLISFGLAIVALAGGGLASAAALGLTDPPASTEFRAELNGYQENQSVSTGASGEFRATLVNDTTLHYVFTYRDLEGGNTLFAHVHFGARSTNGGVSFFLCGGGTKPDPCPNVAGTVEGDVTAADIQGPGLQGIAAGQFGEILRAMRAGTAYANIHTQTWTGGEIRGQINDTDQRQYED